MPRTSRLLMGRTLAGLALALCVSLLFSGRALAQTGAPTLDHFRCYHALGTPIATPGAAQPVVTLRDQFDPATSGGELARVMDAVRLCNPTEKRYLNKITPISDPNNHLTMYRIITAQPSPTRMVTVRNQFGIQRVRVGQAEVLAVPTQKLPHNLPQGLDHFKCYRATGRNINKVVGLNDQFLPSPQVQVLEPFGFCNPVGKKHNDVETPILNPKAHLVCYTITREPFAAGVGIINQFGPQSLSVHEADLLCVPSNKLRVSPAPAG